MPAWPEKRQVIGTNVPRLDGALKTSGKAKYSYDRNLPGMLHAKILRSPYAHAKIVKLNLAAAEASPGVKASFTIKGEGAELHYVGDEICAVAAATEEQARDALRAVEIGYDVLPHVVKEDEALKTAPPGDTKTSGEVDKALAEAAAVIEGFYGAPVITHVCLETHGLVAHPKSDTELTVYASTQAVHGVAGELAKKFGGTVVCETPFMGGGFGSKFNPDVWGFAAVELARKAKAPVKLMLERDEEHWSGGNRPSDWAKVKAAASKEGVLTAFVCESWGAGGHSRGGAGLRMPYIYATKNQRLLHRDVRVNAGDSRAMRAPASPQSSLIMEQAMDDLADALGMDPVAFRIKNLSEENPVARLLKGIYEKELAIGAEKIGWKNRHPRGDKTPGPIKRGMGLGLSTWGGRAGPAQATCRIFPDGRVEVLCGSQDLGTGTMTLVPIVAAEILGLQIADIAGKVGSSIYPPAGGSGGSTSCGGVSLAVAMACTKALDELFKRVAPQLGTEPANLEAEGGRVYVKAAPDKGVAWKAACALLGQQPIETLGDRGEGQGMSSEGAGGAQFAEVSVDVETGQVRLLKIVAVADCGLVMNRLLCESQVYGGVIGGLNYAMFEERRMDAASGQMLNADLEHYKLAAHSDIPEIEVVLLDYPERGVIGIGEPTTIPTAGAIANAVTNAIGVRVGEIPLTPRRVLEALQKGKK